MVLVWAKLIVWAKLVVCARIPMSLPLSPAWPIHLWANVFVRARLLAKQRWSFGQEYLYHKAPPWPIHLWANVFVRAKLLVSAKVVVCSSISIYQKTTPMMRTYNDLIRNSRLHLWWAWWVSRSEFVCTFISTELVRTTKRVIHIYIHIHIYKYA